MITVIIGEKPDSAERIARALAEENLKRKTSKYNIDYWEFQRDSKNYIVVSAVGHLFNLKQIKRTQGYPVLDNIEWVPSFKVAKKAYFTERYFRTIEDVAKDASDFIVSTDYDSEGSLIGYNILRFILGKDDAKRMLFSTLTKQDLVKSYENLIPHLDWGNINAGETRHYLDYFYGISTSRALMSAIKKASKRFAILSAGRVQAPTLVLLAGREMEIRNFVPQPYWQLQLILSIDGNEFIVLYEKERIWVKKEAEGIFEKCKDKPAIVDGIKKKKYVQPPPIPFNITSLQTEAYRLFGYSPQQTMSIAQSLYTRAHCLTGDSLVNLPDGSIVSIEEFVDKKCKEILGLDKGLRVCRAGVTNWIRLGFKKLKKIVLENGDEIKSTHDHKILVMRDGSLEWTKAGELKVGYYVAAPDKLEVKRSENPSTMLSLLSSLPMEKSKGVYVRLNKAFVSLLKDNLKTHLIKLRSLSSSINCKKDTLYKYTNRFTFPLELIKYLLKNRIVNEKDIENNISGYRLANSHNIVNLPFRFDDKLAYFIGLVAADGHLDGKHIVFDKIEKFGNVLKEYEKYFKLKLHEGKKQYYLDSNFLAFALNILCVPNGKKDDKIDISNFVLKQPDNVVLAYIAGFFDGDGSVKLKYTGSKKSKSVRVCFTSRSKIFIKKLKLTLLTFGIPSYIYDYPEHSTKDAQDLLVYTDDFEKLSKLIKSHLKIRFDDWSLAESTHTIEKRFRHTYKLVPIFGDALRNHIKNDGCMDISNQLNHDAKIQKHVLAEVGNELNNDFLRNLGLGDLIWKRIEFIEDACDDTVFDISSTTENFIANGVVVHNCSYPRSSSEKIPPQLGYKQILESLSKIKKYENLCKKLLELPELKPVEGKKVDSAHYAIVPTQEPPKDINQLSASEQRIYDLICRRFFSVFAQPAIRESSQVIFNVNNYRFLTEGRRTIERGWMDFYKPYYRSDDMFLPDIKKGDMLNVESLEILNKKTSPPPRYSQASIIKEMEKRGLGTRATRSVILQTLYDRDYIIGRSIHVSDLGVKMADVIKKYVPDFADEKLTKKFEKDLENIVKGKDEKEKILKRAKKAVIKISEEFKQNEEEIGKELEEAIAKTQNEKSILGRCPSCGKYLKIMFSPKTRKYFVGCTGYKEGCKIIYPLPHNATIYKTNKACEKCKTPIIKVYRRGRRPFSMCLDPKCETKADWGKSKKSIT